MSTRTAREATSAHPAWLLVFFVLSGFPAGAEVRTHTVSGTVRDASGGAIASATVSLRTGEQLVVAIAPTDMQGQFVLRGIPAGSYLLEASSQGFAQAQPLSRSATKIC